MAENRNCPKKFSDTLSIRNLKKFGH